MSYTKRDFWDQYKDYVQECFPRHDRVVDMLLQRGNIRSREAKLLDLGSGGCKEARDLIFPKQYFAVDSAVDPRKDGILCDYRKEFYRIADELPFAPDCFTSIFSAEVTAPQETNYYLYQNIFKTFPSIQWGIVSGFYYGMRRHDLTVQEAGGLESWQSTLDISEVKSPDFTETRILIPGPSQMFGTDVIEVWKLLERTP